MVDTETEIEIEIWIEADIETGTIVVHMVDLQILQLGEGFHVKSIGTGGWKSFLAILLEEGTEKIRAKDTQWIGTLINADHARLFAYVHLNDLATGP